MLRVLGYKDSFFPNPLSGDLGDSFIHSFIDWFIHQFAPPHRTAPPNKIDKILILFIKYVSNWGHFLRFFGIFIILPLGPNSVLKGRKIARYQKYSHPFNFDPKFLKIFMQTLRKYISNISFGFVCICLYWTLNIVWVCTCSQALSHSVLGQIGWYIAQNYAKIMPNVLTFAQLSKITPILYKNHIFAISVIQKYPWGLFQVTEQCKMIPYISIPWVQVQ